MPEPLHLTTTLEARGPAAAILLTEDQVATIAGGPKTPAVKVTVNGSYTFDGRVGRMGGEILLERPGPPSMDEATAEQVRALLAKGAVGGWFALSVDDAQAEFDRLKQAGVDFTDEISEKDYGTDFGIRDPFGNKLRIGTMHPS